MGVFDLISKAVVAVDQLRDRVGGAPPGAAPKAPRPATPAPGVPAPGMPTPGTSAPAPTASPSAEPSLGDPNVAAQVFGRRSCAWCGRTIQLLQAHGVTYRFVNLDDDEGQVFEGPLVLETKKYTVPYVFLRGEYVGGYHELDEIARLGQLEAMTAPLDRRSPHKSGELRIVLPKRGT